MAPQTLDQSEGDKVCGPDQNDKLNKDKGIVGLIQKISSQQVSVQINPYDAQAYLLYQPILPSCNLTVLNHTVHHCQHHFNRVHLHYVFSLENCH